MSTDDNGKINNYETNINPDGTVERVTEPEEVLEPMPMPGKVYKHIYSSSVVSSF